MPSNDELMDMADAVIRNCERRRSLGLMEPHESLHDALARHVKSTLAADQGEDKRTMAARRLAHKHARSHHRQECQCDDC